MPFEWCQTDRSGPNPAKFEQQYLASIRERAKLLCHLKFPAAKATARIQAALAWEFDADVASTPLPSFYGQVPTLVSEVYSHLGGKPAPAAKKKRTARKKKK
jgi:hypothetical protein